MPDWNERVLAFLVKKLQTWNIPIFSTSVQSKGQTLLSFSHSNITFQVFRKIHDRNDAHDGKILISSSKLFMHIHGHMLTLRVTNITNLSYRCAHTNAVHWQTSLARIFPIEQFSHTGNPSINLQPRDLSAWRFYQLQTDRLNGYHFLLTSSQTDLHTSSRMNTKKWHWNAEL